MFDIEITGAGAVIKNLDTIAGKGENLAPAFRTIAGDLLKSHELNFRQHGTRFGDRWPNRKYNYDWPIMKKSGTLSRGFKCSSTARSAEVTNTVSYAKWHQFGTRRLPVRNLIGLAGDGGKTDINNAIRILRKHLMLGDENV